MREPAAIQQLVELASGKLSELAREASLAHDELTIAEEIIDEAYDQVAEDLKDQMAEEERKGDPAEHYVWSVTRRRYRDAYQRWRRAKREVAKLELVSQNRRAELSGYQTESKMAIADGTSSSQAQPQWTSAHQRQRATA